MRRRAIGARLSRVTVERILTPGFNNDRTPHALARRRGRPHRSLHAVSASRQRGVASGPHLGSTEGRCRAGEAERGWPPTECALASLVAWFFDPGIPAWTPTDPAEV